LTDKDPKTYVAHILSEIAFLETTPTKMTFLQFQNDPAVFRAAAYSVQIISEASRKIPPDWLREHPEINWHGIRAIGNQTRHEYASLRSLTIWEIINFHLVPLKSVMEELMQR
jgi:uncharacterized protein with HEPN domain